MNKDETINELLYETLQATLESGKRMGYAQGREETAREILQELYDCFIYQENAREMVEQMAEEHGIELEE